jgi:hypothetical protein
MAVTWPGFNSPSGAMDPNNKFSGGNQFLPSTNPITNGGFSQYGQVVPATTGSNPSSPSGSSNQNTDGPDYGSALGAGLSGLGKGLQAQSQAQEQGAGQQITASNDLMNGVNNQRQMDLNGANAAMQYSTPDKAIIPFEKMAMARALANAGPPQMSLPSNVAPFTAQQNPNPQWQALQQVTNQYFSDPAIMASIAQQNQAVHNLDPNAKSTSLGSIFGNNTPGVSDIQNEMTQDQVGAQTQRYNRDQVGQKALQDALQNAKDNSGGSIWGSILGAVGQAAPFFL